ncbi:unnamed protein product [Aureobasidium pullulans]|nr:unnamed protein product [Aureobasidium pullulans]
MDSLSSPSYIPLDESSICIHFPQSSPLVQRPHISQLFAISPRIAHQSPDLILTGTMTIQMEDILANRVPTPWTYASFVAYLSDNYCLEILQFALAAAQYKERYDFVSSIPGRRVSLPSQESQDLLILWTSLVETYLLPDGEREVNLPSQIRDPIIYYTLEQRAADPQVLESAILATWELMEGLILSSYPRETAICGHRSKTPLKTAPLLQGNKVPIWPSTSMIISSVSGD